MEVAIARFGKYLSGTDYGELSYLSPQWLTGCKLPFVP
jgi:hypothetical protein